MTDGVDLRSVAFLEQARDVLRQFGWQLNNHAGAVTELVARATAEIESVGEARLDELREAERALFSVEDDDDNTYEFERREEAQEALARYRRVAAHIDKLSRSFVERTSILSGRAQQLVKVGTSDLDRRVEALAEYRSIQMPLAGGGYAATSAVGQLQTSADLQEKVAFEQEGEMHLPAGFGWVDLNEVELSGFIDDPEHFNKSDYYTMRRGIEILRDEIIPALRSGRFGREDAERMDRDRGTEYTVDGWIHPESRLTVWRAFLDPRREADVVVLERGADGKYCVTSGRHRLGLARSLGIRMIPARILGVSHGA